MWRRHRRLAIIAALLTVVAAATVGGIAVVRARYGHPVHHADLFGSGTPATSAAPTSAAPSPTPPGAGLTGPLNILISGVDTRVSIKGWQPHSDADMILHVTADLKHAYLFSLPRDTVVQIPSFPKAGFGGERTKLTHAMSYGSHVPGSSRIDTAQGFQLLATTVSSYTGISRFDAGAVLTFNGLAALVNAVGGIDMYVDQQVVSIHMRPDGHPRTADANAPHGFSGPQAVYSPGMRHFVGWQAIDYARQRYTAGDDYTRQRHQRQLIQAIIAKAANFNMLTNPVAMDSITRSLGNALTFDGRGRRTADFAYVLRDIHASMTLVGLRGSGVYSGSSYLGEGLDAVSTGFFAAVAQDRCAAYLAAHPDLVNH